MLRKVCAQINWLVLKVPNVYLLIGAASVFVPHAGKTAALHILFRMQHGSLVAASCACPVLPSGGGILSLHSLCFQEAADKASYLQIPAFTAIIVQLLFLNEEN